MKLSLKLQDNLKQEDQNHHLPFLLRAKLPVTIFNLPFLSSFSTTTHHPSDVSLSLSTNFTSGPILKLTYSTTTSPPPPLTLTLKSGTGLFGSPRNCPLVISANFSFSPLNPNPNPTFSLLLKPQLGSFSLRKTTSSNPNGSGNNGRNNKVKDDGNSFGFVPLDRPGVFKDFFAEESGKDSIFKGVFMMARTELPVEKRFLGYMRWGVRFPGNLSNGGMMGMPYLSVNKIGIEKVDEVKGDEIEKKRGGNVGDVEVLRGMCSWMKRELDGMQRENREMKLQLEELKMGRMMASSHSRGSGGGVGEGFGKKVDSPVAEVSGGYEQWRNKKNGAEENKKKDVKKKGNSASDVESELQKAIKAASAS